MKNIEFRVWDKTNKELISFDDFTLTFITRKNPEIEVGLVDFFSDENYIYSQFTGLKDKNGNKIYEGDIVIRKQAEGGIKNADRKEYICFIDWFMNGWACREHKEHCGFTFGGEHIEVIGNIYENPYLLNNK